MLRYITNIITLCLFTSVNLFCNVGDWSYKIHNNGESVCLNSDASHFADISSFNNTGSTCYCKLNNLYNCPKTYYTFATSFHNVDECKSKCPSSCYNLANTDSNFLERLFATSDKNEYSCCDLDEFVYYKFDGRPCCKCPFDDYYKSSGKTDTMGQNKITDCYIIKKNTNDIGTFTQKCYFVPQDEYDYSFSDEDSDNNQCRWNAVIRE